jgi:nicotinate-nucleotide adenylyltransferase
MMNVGLYFGSFNPVHNGHLEIAMYVLETNLCSEVWFVVSPQNPLKDIREIISEEDRMNMLELAIQKFPEMKICDVEFSMPRPSYTIDTLDKLQMMYPDHVFSIIMGMDNLVVFRKWKSWEDILIRHRLLVYPRQKNTEPELTHPNIHVMTNAPLIDMSSSMIRQKIAAGQPVRNYLDPEVIGYIREHGLYVNEST